MWHGFNTALVTGASSGIGEQFARILARQKMNLILTARSEDRLRTLATELQAAGAGRIEVIPLDLSGDGAAASLWAQVEARQLVPDLLINNAGVGLGGPFHAVSLEKQVEMIQLNVVAVVQLTHCFLQRGAAAGNGGVINVASMAGLMPLPGMAVYAATKAFVASFSEGLRQELAGSGVRVMAALPGITPTGFQQTAGVDAAGVLQMSVVSAERVAAESLAAFAAGQARWVPGLLNRLGSRVLPVVPQRLLGWFAARMMVIHGS